MGTCRPAVIATRARPRRAVPSGSFRAGLKEVDMPTDAGGVRDARCPRTGRAPRPLRRRRRKDSETQHFPRPIDEPATLPIFYSRRWMGWEGKNGCRGACGFVRKDEDRRRSRAAPVGTTLGLRNEGAQRQGSRAAGDPGSGSIGHVRTVCSFVVAPWDETRRRRHGSLSCRPPWRTIGCSSD